jgi:hypothetical protein
MNMRLEESKGFTPITQKSIDSVKCTRIISGEKSEKYNKYIQRLAKRVLSISLNRNSVYMSINEIYNKAIR